MCRERRLFSGKDITMTVFLFADEYFGVNVYFFVVKHGIMFAFDFCTVTQEMCCDPFNSDEFRT